MVRIEIDYRGELRCEATHGPSGARLQSDAPVDNHGRGESFSPTDLTATALGTCMLTCMGIVAEREGWDLAGARVSVEKGMVADPHRRVGALRVAVHHPGGLDVDARAILEETALGCPVLRSLDPRIEIPVAFDWGQDAGR